MHGRSAGFLALALGGACHAGEVLHNGIVLPEQWPPRPGTWGRQTPVTPPYLETPPETISIDVGRQLFVDDFLIAQTDLKRTYHLLQSLP